MLSFEWLLTTMNNVFLLLLALAVLTTKHVIFDFFFQTSYQWKNKGIYGHPGGLLHAGLHAMGTCAVFLVLTSSAALATAIVVGEFLVHYHIDWAKERVGRRMKWGFEQNGYWRAMGVDQWLHQLTYLGIVGVLATA